MSVSYVQAPAMQIADPFASGQMVYSAPVTADPGFNPYTMSSGIYQNWGAAQPTVQMAAPQTVQTVAAPQMTYMQPQSFAAAPMTTLPSTPSMIAYPGMGQFQFYPAGSPGAAAAKPTASSKPGASKTTKSTKSTKTSKTKKKKGCC